MRIELKGLIAAIIASLAVLGATFGVSALVVRLQASQDRPHAPVGNAPKPVNAAFIAQGHALYTQSCASCHGAGGVGGYGPSLHREDLSDAQIALKIKNGVKGKMPAFAGQYNDKQVQALVAYIRSLN